MDINNKDTIRRGKIRFRDRAPDLLCLVLIAGAFSAGFRATHDLEYPFDIDFNIYISYAQSTLDGHWLEDPYYAGEKQWYNPLVPWLIAATAKVFNVPVAVACVRMGAFVNLLAPLCFYLLGARLFGKWIALAGTTSFLFILKPFLPGCYLGTYSPWMYSNNFVQAFFYLGLLVYLVSRDKKTVGWAAASGVLLGVTFLGHATPAMILGFVILIMELRDMVMALRPGGRDSTGHVGRRVIRAAVLFGTAFLVSLPILSTILFHYRLRILNGEPNDWIPSFLKLENLGSFWTIINSKRNLVALIGMITLAMKRPRSDEKRILFLWVAASAGFVAYSYIRQVMERRGAEWFGIVPANHFFFYLNAALAMCFGYGLAMIGRFSADLAARMRFLPAFLRSAARERVLLSFLLLVCLIKYCPLQAARFDYTIAPEKSREVAEWSDRRRSVEWIRTHTDRSEVFLSNDMWGMYVVGPAGRKCVAVWDVCSNPYVDWRTRNADREAMVRYLTGKSADKEAFLRLVSVYGVRFVIADPREWDISETLPVVRRVFSGNAVDIFRILE
jgi:hypothetical protein